MRVPAEGWELACPRVQWAALQACWLGEWQTSAWVASPQRCSCTHEQANKHTETHTSNITTYNRVRSSPAQLCECHGPSDDATHRGCCAERGHTRPASSPNEMPLFTSTMGRECMSPEPTRGTCTGEPAGDSRSPRLSTDELYSEPVPFTESVVVLDMPSDRGEPGTNGSTPSAKPPNSVGPSAPSSATTGGWTSLVASSSGSSLGHATGSPR